MWVAGSHDDVFVMEPLKAETASAARCKPAAGPQMLRGAYVGLLRTDDMFHHRIAIVLGSAMSRQSLCTTVNSSDLYYLFSCVINSYEELVPMTPAP